MKELLTEMKQLLPAVTFTQGRSSFWSPKDMTITYTEGGEHAAWTLLHESAHALLDHTGYNHDVDLLLLEVAAWEKAKELATRYQMALDDEYIQTCLDTYRDWLHSRGTCPSCHTVSTQTAPTTYHCYNCETEWQVSTSRFCRPYRLVKIKNYPLLTSG